MKTIHGTASNCRTCDQHWYDGVTSECPRGDCEFKRRFNESCAVVIPTRPPPPAPRGANDGAPLLRIDSKPDPTWRVEEFEPAKETAAGEDSGIERELARNGVMLVDCNLSEPTGVDSIATREWCVKSAEIEGEAEIGAGTPTGVDVPRLLALLKRARHFSDGMNLAAYEAIQEAICELEPNQPNDHPR